VNLATGVKSAVLTALRSVVSRILTVISSTRSAAGLTFTGIVSLLVVAARIVSPEGTLTTTVFSKTHTSLATYAEPLLIVQTGVKKPEFSKVQSHSWIKRFVPT